MLQFHQNQGRHGTKILATEGIHTVITLILCQAVGEYKLYASV